MNSTIYFSASGEGMTKGDLIDYLKMFYVINPQFISWDFDNITGGESEFVSREVYIEVKRYFEKIIIL
jgi:hypothetical protein